MPAVTRHMPDVLPLWDHLPVPHHQSTTRKTSHPNRTWKNLTKCLTSVPQCCQGHWNGDQHLQGQGVALDAQNTSSTRYVGFPTPSNYTILCTLKGVLSDTNNPALAQTPRVTVSVPQGPLTPDRVGKSGPPILPTRYKTGILTTSSGRSFAEDSSKGSEKQVTCVYWFAGKVITNASGRMKVPRMRCRRAPRAAASVPGEYGVHPPLGTRTGSPTGKSPNRSSGFS